MKPAASRILRLLLVSIVPCWIADSTLLAQRGDRAGHDMKPPPEHWKIPAAPVMTADRALATFAVEDGFRIELIAAEPMIHDPVAIAFDGNGRIWVAEMRGFMPTIDGKGEKEPTGVISVLEDNDGDGKADRNAVFLDGIVLPRTVAFADADRSLIYADDNDLYEVPIIEQDGGLPIAGEPKLIDEGFSKGGNPEHKPNGMRYALDNWYYNAKSDTRYRKVGGKWIKEKTEFRGQWGIDQDDYGRLYTNTNSNFVTAETLPPGIRKRNPHHDFRVSGEVKLRNQQTWPARINPGINRGYLNGFLDDEGYLRRPTAVSGLTVYRGDQFPPEYSGNLFLNEPGGNLVKRAVVTRKADGGLTIEPAYEEREFFTSTDERSRIVNGYTAPDGTLVLVDLYRGILQHGAYMTTYLRQQVEERALDKPVGLGRLWRVVHEGKEPGPQPKLIDASNAELAQHLGHPNGWWRDTAQRLLVQRGGADAVGAVKKVLGETDNPLATIHAIWALEGLGGIDREAVAAALRTDDPRAVAEVIRASGSIQEFKRAQAVFEELAEHIAETESPIVRHAALAGLGKFPSEPESRIYGVMLDLLEPTGGKDALAIDLAMSGISGMESDVLGLALARSEKKSNVDFLTDELLSAIVASNDAGQIAEARRLIGNDKNLNRQLASAALKHRRGGLIRELLNAAAETEAVRAPIVEGLLATRKSIGGKYKPVALGKELPAIIKKPGLIPPDQNLALGKMFDFSGAAKANFIKTDAAKKQYEAGKTHYERICFACHQPHGRGQQFLAPPLVDSEWVTGPKKRLIAVTMDGMIGPVHVNGTLYEAPEIQPIMPGLRANPEVNDEQLAAILTYVRNAWGNAAEPISTEEVKAYRDTSELRAPLTEEELKKIK